MKQGGFFDAALSPDVLSGARVMRIYRVRLPDFIIIGAAKAGTTSLYALLERHPDVFMPVPKEPEFFARDDHYAKGITEYAALFEKAEPSQVVGEASTLYSLAPHFGLTAERIKAHIPSVKLIYVLREPVSRAYSFYVQLIKNYQNVTGDRQVHRRFEEFIDPKLHRTAAPRDKVLSVANAHLPDTPELCLSGSDYVTQINAYLAHFPAEQILFLSFEDFVRDRASTVKKITDFLGIPALEPTVFSEQSVTRNVSKDHFDGLALQSATEQLRAKSGGLWSLRKVLPKPVRERFKAALLTKRASRHQAHIPPPMLDETRRFLHARFEADRATVGALTGLDLNHWQTKNN